MIKKVEVRSALHGWGEMAVLTVDAAKNMTAVSAAAQADGWNVVGVNIPERKVYLERGEELALKARERDLIAAINRKLDEGKNCPECSGASDGACLNCGRAI